MTRPTRQIAATTILNYVKNNIKIRQTLLANALRSLRHLQVSSSGLALTNVNHATKMQNKNGYRLLKLLQCTRLKN